MSNWAKFDKQFNAETLKNINAQAQTNNSNSFDELPLGKYEVSVESLELVESKAGDPMTKTVFKVVAGDYTNRLIFKNSVIYKGDDKDDFRISSELRFIKSLDTRKNPISFDGFEKFETLLNNVLAEIQDEKLEYLLKINERKGFRYYTIEEVYGGQEPQEPNLNDGEEVPF